MTNLIGFLYFLKHDSNPLTKWSCTNMKVQPLWLCDLPHLLQLQYSGTTRQGRRLLHFTTTTTTTTTEFPTMHMGKYMLWLISFAAL